MAVYPDIDTVPYASPVIQSPRWKTLVSEFESGAETRKRKWLYPRRRIELRYANVPIGKAETLWEFYIARSGRFEAFSWFHRDTSISYVGEYVGPGDGSTKVFNLPSKQASLRTLKVDGVSQTEGVDWMFDSEGGADGADKATFNTAPPDGDRITFDFTGKLKVRCRFLEDIVSFDIFFNKLMTTGITLEGLLNS